MIAAVRDQRASAQANAADACYMADGSRIEIFANLGALADADAAMTAGAEGCGLLRTELLFLDRDTPPDEAEQSALCAAIAERMAGRPAIIRTLDIGSDKPARYLPIAIYQSPGRRTRRSACAASASGCTIPTCSTRNCARSCVWQAGNAAFSCR